MNDLVELLKAVGEPTRLRILTLVQQGALTTTELTKILGQTQPRVSRHLKLLVEAGCLRRSAEGVRAYYRLCNDNNRHQLIGTVLGCIAEDDPQYRADLRLLENVRVERQERAMAYFSSVAPRWEKIRQLHAADAEVEQAVLDTSNGFEGITHVDIGTGTGRMLELLAAQTTRSIGIDNNLDMLNVARANLDKPGLEHCEVRQAEASCAGLDDAVAGIVTIHHVLHFLDDPSPVIIEAARLLRPGGRLVVVDFADHELERLRSDFNHRWLGFRDDHIHQLMGDAQLEPSATTCIRVDEAEGQQLTVMIWSAHKPTAAKAHDSVRFHLERAS